MSAPAEKKLCAWQPLTPRGVSAFAGASFGRLLLIQFLVAALVAALSVWLVYTVWFPVISTAIGSLPEHSQIRAGQLEWSGDPACVLGENRFLSLSVDLNHAGAARSPAHVQVEFGRFDMRILSVFGVAEWDYPRSWGVPLGRPEMAARWGAWAPALLTVIGLGVLLVLPVVWAVLACFYFLPAWLVGLFADRSLSLAGSWRLAGAALMPGAFVMCASLVGYGKGGLTLLDLTCAVVVHFVIGWLFLAISPLFLSSRQIATPGNPFGAPATDDSKTISAQPANPVPTAEK